MVQNDWFERGGRGFLLLSTSEQRDLHDYFATTGDLSDEELLLYRRQVSADDSSLPHRAGRAFVPLELATKHPEIFGRDGVATTKGRTLAVYPVVNPNKDERDRRLIDDLARLYFEPAIQPPLDEMVKPRSP